jgi:hypothetical protein
MSARKANTDLDCYFCPATIATGSSYVLWDETCFRPGTKHTLLLHPKCAVMLAERLIGDAFEANPQVDTQGDVLLLTKSRMEQGIRHHEREAKKT